MALAALASPLGSDLAGAQLLVLSQIIILTIITSKHY